MTLRQDTIKLGIGYDTSNIESNFDWQQFDAPSNASIYVSIAGWKNPPTQIIIPSSATYAAIWVSWAAFPTAFEVILSLNSPNVGDAYQYRIRITGAKGSRSYSVRKVFNEAEVVPIANGGTGATTAALARTALQLGTAATRDTGTSGFTIPLLSQTNTWGGLQYFDSVSIGQARTNSTVLELGSLTTAVSSNIDFHSSGVNQDFDARLSVNGGVQGTSGKADVRLTAGSFSTTSMSLDTALPISSGGTGSKDAAGARTGLGLGTSATINTGTSGATIPLLSTSNTWSNTQFLSSGTNYIGNATTGNTFLKIGNSTQSGLVLFDMRTSGLSNDYDVRMQFSGGVQGSNGKGALNFSIDTINASNATSVKFASAALQAKSASFTDALPVTSGGTGGNTPALARKGLELDETATDIDFRGAKVTTRETHASGIFASKPSSGGVNGGQLKSDCIIAGVEVASAYLQMLKTVNSTDTTARLTVYQKGTGGVGGSESTKNFDFASNGNFYMDGTQYVGGVVATNIVATNTISAAGSILANAGSNVGVAPHNTNSNNGIRLWAHTNDADQGQYVNTVSGGWYAGNWALGAVRGGGTDLRACQLNVSGGSGGGNASYMFKPNGVADGLQWNNVSDRRQKKDIKTIENPIDKMKLFHGVTFTYLNGVPSAGYIAQDVQEVLPEVVTADHEGMLSMNVAGVGALHHEAILALIARVEELEKKIAELTSQ